MIHISIKDIERFITEGESDKVEFKEKLPSDASVSKVLSAFANTDGGVLLIGISNEGEIIGIRMQR